MATTRLLLVLIVVVGVVDLVGVVRAIVVVEVRKDATVTAMATRRLPRSIDTNTYWHRQAAVEYSSASSLSLCVNIIPRGFGCESVVEDTIHGRYMGKESQNWMKKE